MIYMFIAEGFEEIEALCPLDLMRRAGLEVVTVGIGGGEITGAHGITVKTDITDVDYPMDAKPEMIFLPGGMPGTLNLAASKVVTDAIRSAAERNAYISAICAAFRPRFLLMRRIICCPGSVILQHGRMFFAVTC